MKPFHFIPVSKANYRALEIARNILINKGVEIVELDFNDIIDEIVLGTFTCFFSVPMLLNLLQNKVKDI